MAPDDTPVWSIEEDDPNAPAIIRAIRSRSTLPPNQNAEIAVKGCPIKLTLVFSFMPNHGNPCSLKIHRGSVEEAEFWEKMHKLHDSINVDRIPGEPEHGLGDGTGYALIDSIRSDDAVAIAQKALLHMTKEGLIDDTQYTAFGLQLAKVEQRRIVIEREMGNTPDVLGR